MDRPAMDFMSEDFRAIAGECAEGLRRVFKTENPILIYAASGHGAWEAALVNLFSPGDKVLSRKRYSRSTGAASPARWALSWRRCRAIGAPASIPPPSRLA